MYFNRFSVCQIRSLFQAIRPFLMPILYPIITKTYQASFCDMVYKSARDALSHIFDPSLPITYM